MTKTPKTTRECEEMGWKQAHVSSGEHELSVSHSPDSELDSTFLAFDHDEQELIKINGWLMDEYMEVATTVK